MTSVEICEVSPRDGLQNEKTLVSTSDKIELVNRAIAAGVKRLEVTSFVNPNKVPQMADAEEVLAGLDRPDGISFIGLVMNQRGLDRALAAGVHEANIVVVASDTFCQRNQGVSSQESIAVAADLVEQARAGGLATTITIGASFGCPFEGEIPLARLERIIRDVVDANPDELALADTIGVASPKDIDERVALALGIMPSTMRSRLHLHDTRHTGVANAVAAVAAGIQTLDSSIAGSGGCPFAPNATGNVATEDLVYTFNRMGVSTGLDLDSLIDSARWLETILQKPMSGAVARAGNFPGVLLSS